MGRALREGRTSCVEILAGCLAQVDEWEPRVHAWVVLNQDRALKQARALDDELKNGIDRGPLHGMPIGIKDIIDVAGLPTACGARRWANKVAAADAAVVTNLRETGAVIMGKTVTTAYAWIDPPITRNPWNLERTPGGSSSGSAAAVACGMCLGAIGTQTGGSITRPASFCGVAGMKPARVYMSRKGVFPFSFSLDHVGAIARTVDDLGLIFGGASEYQLTYKSTDAPLRLARLRGFFERRADPVMKSAIDDAARVLVAHGIEIVELDDPVDFEQILIDHRKVMAAEAASVHSDWLEENPDDYPRRIRDLILEGRPLKALDYLNAKKRMTETRRSIVAALRRDNCRALFTPATTGAAPDPSTTGDPAFNSPWSFTGLPTVSFPIGLAPDGMPLAAQLVGYYELDVKLLSVAHRCEQAIRTARQ